MSHEFADFVTAKNPSDATCRKCGITAGEWWGAASMSSPPLCTGNAYICRVARKLAGWFVATQNRQHLPYFTFGVRGYMSTRVTEIRAWDMTVDEFARLIDKVLSLVINLWSPPLANNTMVGLVERIKTDPTVCPILADALEEAGCEDSSLLEALRAP